jgi:hypothetical protein
MKPHVSIPVGVVVERRKGTSPWPEVQWSPASVLTGIPDTPSWTPLTDNGERATFYAGATEIELHRTETGNYRNNLMTDVPVLWVVLEPTNVDPPCRLAIVTADPAEAEAVAGLGNGEIVETVPMPPAIEVAIAAFVAEHHVERAFVKRRRDRANPEKMARRTAHNDDEKR